MDSLCRILLLMFIGFVSAAPHHEESVGKEFLKFLHLIFTQK